MNNRKTAVFLLCILLAVFTAALACTKKTDPPEMDPETKERIKAEELAAFEKLEESKVGRYIYKEKLLSGEAEPMAERMDKQFVLEIVSGSESYQQIAEALENRQEYPDYVGGSGVTITEYWFDAEGTQKALLVKEQSQVYIVTNEGEETNYELIYD